MFSILIPAYNEAASIQGTIRSVHETMIRLDIPYEVIVIDDGSTDETPALARSMEVRLLQHPTNGGYGHALKTGLHYARYDWIVIMDADGSYPIHQLPQMLEYVPQFDMVVGARKGENFWGGFSKRLGRFFQLKLTEFVIGEHIPDVNSGFRIFRKAIARRHIQRISSGFSFTTTLTLAVWMEQHFVKYVPIDYYERTGSSKVRYGRDTLRMLQIMAQAIIYYNPLKLFLVLVGITLTAGLVLALGAWTLGTTDGWQLFSTSIFLALIISSIGFLAEGLRLNRIEDIYPPNVIGDHDQYLMDTNVKTDDSADGFSMDARDDSAKFTSANGEN